MGTTNGSRRGRGLAGVIAGLGLLGLPGLIAPPLADAQPRTGLPLLPGGSASPPAGASSAESPPATAPTPAGPLPGSSPPPYMVEEPYTPPEASPVPSAPAPADAAPSYGAPYPAPPVYYGPPYPGWYGPSPYAYEPPPPPPPPAHRAPRTALWLGARAGMLQPFGKLYYYDTGSSAGPSWGDAAGPGASIEVDVGGRFGRRYLVYGFWEYAQLDGGDAFHGPGDGAPRASTSLWGVGLRWSSSPDETGLALDVGLGYRTFDLAWDDGTSLRMSSPFEMRLGIGADIRLSRTFTLSPMFQLTNGVFDDGTYSPAGAPSYSVGGVAATHGTIGLTVGGHFDLAGSQR